MIEVIATKRKWIHCPYCGAKHSIYDDRAECRGVYLVCTRKCKQEFELVIHDGEQVMKSTEKSPVMVVER